MINEILAACIPVFIFAILAVVVITTTEPEQDTKFEDIGKKK